LVVPKGIGKLEEVLEGGEGIEEKKKEADAKGHRVLIDKVLGRRPPALRKKNLRRSCRHGGKKKGKERKRKKLKPAICFSPIFSLSLIWLRPKKRGDNIRERKKKKGKEKKKECRFLKCSCPDGAVKPAPISSKVR